MDTGGLEDLGGAGETLRVLFETTTDGITDGLTDNYIRVYTDDPVEDGEIYEVKLDRLYKDGAFGHVVARDK